MIDEIVANLPHNSRWATNYEVEQAIASNESYTRRMVQVRRGDSLFLAITIGPGEDDNGNVTARDGIDKCSCGVKYWENDHCVDCGSHVTATVQ